MEASEVTTQADWKSDVLALANEPEPIETSDEPAEEPGATDTPPAADAAPAVDSDTPPAAVIDSGAQPNDSPAADAAPVAAQPTPSPQVEKQPFRLRADGADIDAPGAFEVNGHVVMPRETWNRIVQPRLVADRRALIEQHRREVEDAKAGTDEVVERARLTLEEMEHVLGSEDELFKFAGNLAQNAEALKLRVENAVLKKGQQARTQREQSGVEEQQVEALRTQLQTSLDSGIDRVLALDEFKDLGLQKGEVKERLWELRTAGLFIEAREGDGTGYLPGTPLLNIAFIRKQLEPAASVARRIRAAAAEREAAAEHNRRALQPNAAPPAVASRTSAEPIKTKKEPTNHQEWRESVLVDED